LIIKVKLYAALEKYANGKIGRDNSLDVPENITIQQLIHLLNLPAKGGKIFLINGISTNAESEIHEGDEVRIFSLTGGG
jgi:sulfur carrier protein ThiS